MENRMAGEIILLGAFAVSLVLFLISYERRYYQVGTASLLVCIVLPLVVLAYYSLS